MATEALRIADDDALRIAAAAADDDDEISILCTPPAVFKNGATKSDGISVDDYRRTAKVFIDLTQDDDEDEDDVVEQPPSSSSTKRFYKGESSNSKQPLVIYDAVLRLSFTCEICTDEKPISDSCRIAGCDHCYCTQCVTNYVAAKLQENITGIGCPVPRCAGFLEPQHCRTILPKDVFERWGDALCEAMILEEERFYCPYKDCSALLIDDGGQKLTQSECPECRRLFCVNCKAAWHSGIECAEFQKLRKDERSNEDIMLMNLAKNSNWMRCSKCGFFVSKTDGCLYMLCRCGYSFCYKCGAHMEKHLHYCTKCNH